MSLHLDATSAVITLAGGVYKQTSAVIKVAILLGKFSKNEPPSVHAAISSKALVLEIKSSGITNQCAVRMGHSHVPDDYTFWQPISEPGTGAKAIAVLSPIHPLASN
ncbi:hypothetical protein BV22DRAFT_1132167 [Leucogyrophana mollusca]|uniref:Uncharacterized protein n=1 Tax=Leucogyrophana mollusca TaxID=85980 RepID=A0ACB8B707_9AGAM|nr:hypothetical protein BV22DRAFT_1132167 [Leucogyrophana mollusca]